MLVWLLIVAHANSCSLPTGATKRCAATQDVVLVVDNSYSLADRYASINRFIGDFVANFELDTANPLSPRVGRVSFSGCRWNLLAAGT